LDLSYQSYQSYQSYPSYLSGVPISFSGPRLRAAGQRSPAPSFEAAKLGFDSHAHAIIEGIKRGWISAD
jgi:hypothetical protein